MRKALALAFLLLCAVALPAQAASVHPRDCILRVGPDQMTFTAFQQQRSHETFCTHIPDAGPAVLILDADQNELRDMQMEIRILRDVGQQDWRDGLQENTVHFLVPKKYFAEKGSISFDYDFPGDGRYILLVRAIGDDPTREYVGQYSFSVGETLVFYISLAVAFVAFLFIAFGVWGHAQRKQVTSAGAPAAARRPHGDRPAPSSH